MAEFASKGVAGTGLGLGIAGTALGLLNGNGNILGGLLGGGSQLTALQAENSLLKRASEILCPWDNRSPPNGCIQ